VRRCRTSGPCCATWFVSRSIITGAPTSRRAIVVSSGDGFIGTSLAPTLSLFERAAEAVRLGAGFENVRTVSDAIQECLAQARVRNDLSPLRKREVGRQQHGCTSARSAMTWKRNSAPSSARGT
jgi:hypothetical protein